MASYSLLEFLGTGSLKDMGGKLAEDGWDDVPTLKVIGAQDMEALALTNAQRVSVSPISCMFWFRLLIVHNPYARFNSVSKLLLTRDCIALHY